MPIAISNSALSCINHTMVRKFYWTSLILLFSSVLVSQGIPVSIQKTLNEKIEKWGLTSTDINNLRITDQYTDLRTGVTYIYLQQTINNVPVDRSITPLAISSEGKIFTSGSGFYKNIENRIRKSSGELLSQIESVHRAAEALKIQIPERILPTSSRWEGVDVYTASNYIDEIRIEKVYVEDKEESFRLSWKIYLADPESADTWEVFIDPTTGEVVNKYSQTIYCKHGVDKLGHHSGDCRHVAELSSMSLDAPTAEYLVFPFPLVNPLEGGRSIESDNKFQQASPLGWHATSDNGNYRTFTRGNNVHAYEDSGSNNGSVGNEPNGGDNLVFNFDLNLSIDPDLNQEASTTQLFYGNNMSHDLFYLLGFTESAGNFQENNLGLGGVGGDYVRAETLDGSDIGNANFNVVPDGVRGRMQMYKFSNLPSFIQIEEPQSLSELSFEIGTASFGTTPSQTNVEAEVTFAVTNDSENPTEGCQAIINDVNNKVALIDRGSCDFSLKVFNAQQAGAVMSIVCNIEGVDGGTGDEIINMAAGDQSENVSIPSVFMKKSDCDVIKTTIRNGQSVIISAREREAEGAQFFDSSFDNLVVIHEYAHGVSIRLTGGPNNAGCLPDFDDNRDGNSDRGEQMGEGWSDFFGLIFTTKTGDIGEMPRGIGNYLLNAESDQGGFRPYPYSTDMDINPLTYDDIKTQSVPHGVGTVWASILWDIYWAMIDLYGFNPDWTDTNSGNYRAAFLVMEGMKLQPCRPGFVDGRDAILEADFLHNNGAHESLIWTAFARRGVGINAIQGSGTDNRDGTEDFSIPPLLIEELKISKEVSNFVDPGENYDVTLNVVNHIPSTQTGVTINDELPDGTVYVDGSGNIEPEVMGNMLVFDLGDLEYLEETTIQYKINSDPDNISNTLYYDDVESGNTDWTIETKKGTRPWSPVTNQSLSGETSWYIEETDNEEVDQLLISPSILVTGSNPVLRFWHRYKIISGANGGFIEISTDGVTWEKVEDKFIIRNEYPGELAFGTFGIPSLQGFSGSTDLKWVDSYIDLNSYKGKNINVRFRFGNEGDLVSTGDDPGWFIDDIELIDLKFYTSSACVFSSQDPAERCTEIKNTVVNTTSTTNTDDGILDTEIKIYPNPASESFYLTSSQPLLGNISLKSTDGRLVFNRNVNYQTQVLIDVNDLSPGLYFLLIQTDGGFQSRKIIVTNGN